MGEKEWPTVGKLFVACFARSRFLKNRIREKGAREKGQSWLLEQRNSSTNFKEPTRLLDRRIPRIGRIAGVGVSRASGHSECTLRSKFRNQICKTEIRAPLHF